MFQSKIVMTVVQSSNILKTIELLNGWILWCVKYISVKTEELEEGVKEEYTSEENLSSDIENMTTGVSGTLMIRTEAGLRAARFWRPPSSTAINAVGYWDVLRARGPARSSRSAEQRRLASAHRYGPVTLSLTSLKSDVFQNSKCFKFYKYYGFCIQLPIYRKHRDPRNMLTSLWKYNQQDLGCGIL